MPTSSMGRKGVLEGHIPPPTHSHVGFYGAAALPSPFGSAMGSRGPSAAFSPPHQKRKKKEATAVESRADKHKQNFLWMLKMTHRDREGEREKKKALSVTITERSYFGAGLFHCSAGVVAATSPGM